MKYIHITCLVLVLIIMLTTVSCKRNNNNIQTTNDTTKNTQSQTTQPTTINTTSNTIGTMALSELYFKPKQASSVCLVNAQGLSSSEIAALRCLQGLVARYESAEIYIVFNDTDRFWSDNIKDDYGMVFVETNFEKIFKKYAYLIDSVILYNSNVVYQYAVAQTFASIVNGIPLDNDTYNKLKPYIGELMTTDISKKINSAAAAVTWTINQLYDSCENNYIGIVDINSEINDYLYATRSAAVTIDFSDKAQIKALKELLSKHFKTPAVAFTDNISFSDILSSYGFSVLNCDGFANCTFFASFPNSAKNISQPAPADKKAVDGKTYISFCINNDGELPAMSDMENMLNNVIRGSTPISIEIKPSLYELAPTVLSWYYQNRDSNTCFISCGSGLANINTDKLGASELDKLYTINNDFLKNLGLGIISSNSKNLNNIVSKLDIQAAICSDIKASKMMDDVSVIKSIKIDDINKFNNYNLNINANGAQFLCYYINISDLSGDFFDKLDNMVYQFEQANNSNVVFLTLNDLSKTMKQYNIQKQSTSTVAANIKGTSNEN